MKMFERLPHGSTVKERLEAYSMPVTETGCLLWLAGCTRDGYGLLNVGGRHERAHRLSYVTYVGKIPPSLCVLHRCDTPGCINPEHLFLGTHHDNMTDMFAKERRQAARGEGHSQAKLSDNDVREISGLLRDTVVSRQIIATQFGVSVITINDINRGRTWSHLTGASALNKFRAPL